MYDETYEDYIRSILGYPKQNNPSFDNNVYDNGYNMTYRQNSELEECYPEIYKIVYPMVCKACSSNTKPLTRETIENMTDEIYFSVEGNNEVNININLGNEVKTAENRNSPNNVNAKKEIKSEVKQTEVRENRSENRNYRNNTLRDLIKILIIKQLIGRPGSPNQRPPIAPPPPPGGRPPFPGGPGPMRPPIRPRGMDYNYNIYEI